jgi:hypothetical protein
MVNLEQDISLYKDMSTTISCLQDFLPDKTDPGKGFCNQPQWRYPQVIPSKFAGWVANP